MAMKPFDIEKEPLLTLKEAIDLPFVRGRRPGKKPDYSTFRRHALSGKLEAVKIGGSIYTSREAVLRSIYGREIINPLTFSAPKFRAVQHDDATRRLKEAGF